MKAVVSFTNVSEEEEGHLRRHLGDIKATAAEDDPLQQCGSMEDVFALRIENEVAAYVEREKSERVAAQARLGEVFIQLPEADRQELIGQLVERAQAHDIDVTSLIEGAP